MCARWLVLAVALAAAPPLAAQSVTDPVASAAGLPAPLASRARELLPILNGGGDPRATFAPEFLAAVPEGKLREVTRSVTQQLGRAQAIVHVRADGPYHAELVIAYEGGTARAVLTLNRDQPGQVAGFVLDRVEPADIAAMRTLEDVAQAFAALPGAVGFVVSDTAATRGSGVESGFGSGGDPQVALDPDRPLAIASTFKLAILAELVRSIEAGERKWSDTATLGTRELPWGGFNQLPPGTRVTLRRLAEEMIRVSDNSATDVLLHEFGRRRVEGMLGPIGWRYADFNAPLLSTMELFKLKGIDNGMLGARYLAASPLERRRMLEDEVTHLPSSQIGALYADGRPVLIDGIEWFATPMDLVRTMGWFAARAQTPAGAEALRILALNPGPAGAFAGSFGAIGYKGGSEPGVVSMTVLLRDRVARWKVVTATWNDPAAPVDEARFHALFARALALLADG